MTIEGKKVGFKWKNRKKPTPYKIKRFGDALFGAFGMLSASLIGSALMGGADQNKLTLYVAIGSLVLGALGKFLSLLFAEDEAQEA